MTPEQLKAHRLNLGLTQEAMAEKLGISGRTYQRHESQKVPTPIAKLASTLQPNHPAKAGGQSPARHPGRPGPRTHRNTACCPS